MTEILKQSYFHCLKNFKYTKIIFFFYIGLEFLMKIKNFPYFFETGTISDFVITLIFSMMETTAMISFLLVFQRNEFVPFKRSIQLLPGYILYSLIYGLTVLLGLIFFFIPGIIFSINLFFTPLLSIVEPDSELSYTKKSKVLVSGHWWFVSSFAGFALVLFLFSTLNNFITDPYGKWIAAVIFAIVSTALTYFTTAMYYHLYLYLYLEKNSQ